MTRPDTGRPLQAMEAAASHAAATAKNNREGGDLADEIDALTSMSYPDLQAAWRRHFRYCAPKKLGRALLELGIAWKLQERVHGGLSTTTKRRLDELARGLATGSDLSRQRTIALKPGARLIREWGGETHEILVTEEGFVWRGTTWASLSIIARKMTGTRWSGPRFFGIGAKQDRDVDA